MLILYPYIHQYHKSLVLLAITRTNKLSLNKASYSQQIRGFVQLISTVLLIQLLLVLLLPNLKILGRYLYTGHKGTCSLGSCLYLCRAFNTYIEQ